MKGPSLSMIALATWGALAVMGYYCIQPPRRPDVGPGKAHLVLRVWPTVLIAPAWVAATVRLYGNEGLEEFWCLPQQFDWGDGNISGQREDCGPYSPGDHVRTVWQGMHEYRTRGDFVPVFSLGRHNVTAGSVEVR